ncbi:hypothetical protein Tco_0946406 [Tanacetum coccineum]
MNQNYYDPNLCYNFNSCGFDQYQPPQYSVTHQTPMAELLLEEKLSQALQALCEKLNKNVQEKQEEKNVAEEQEEKLNKNVQEKQEEKLNKNFLKLCKLFVTMMTMTRKVLFL